MKNPKKKKKTKPAKRAATPDTKSKSKESTASSPEPSKDDKPAAFAKTGTSGSKASIISKFAKRSIAPRSSGERDPRRSLMSSAPPPKGPEPVRPSLGGSPSGTPSKPSMPPPVPVRGSRPSRPPSIPPRLSAPPEIPSRASVPPPLQRKSDAAAEAPQRKVREDSTEELDLSAQIIEDEEIEEVAQLEEEEDNAPTQAFGPATFEPPSFSAPPPLRPPTFGKIADEDEAAEPEAESAAVPPLSAEPVEAQFFGKTIAMPSEPEVPEAAAAPSTPAAVTVPELAYQPTLSSVPPPPSSPSEIVEEIMSASPDSSIALKFESDTVPDAKALVEACEAELSLAPDKVRASRLHFEIGQAYDLILGKESQALKSYQRSIDLAPESIPAIRGARRILLKQRSYAAAVKLFDAEIQASGNPEIKAALHLAKGRLLEDQLHQQAKARQSYAKALDLDPGNPCIIEALKQVDLKSKNWTSVSKLLEKASNSVATDPSYRAALMAQRARLSDTRLKETEVAVELYQNALTLDPVASGAFPALRPLLYAQARWHDLVTLLKKETERVTNPAVQATHYIQISRIYSERLGDREKAVLALERAIEISPNSALALEELADHHEARGDRKSQVDALIRLIGALDVQSEKLGIIHRVARIYEKQLSDADSAIKWYEEALRIDPAYLPAIHALGELYAQSGRFEALIQMCSAEARVTEDTKRRADAHARIAVVYEHHLNDPRQAIVHHAEALALLPSLETSFKSLTRLLSQAKLYKDLIELYEQAISQTSESEIKIAYLFKIGALFEDALNRPDLAVAPYQRILSVSQNHLGAVHAIQLAAEAGGRHQDLIDALKTEASLTRGKAREVHLLQRVGEVYDAQLDDKETALTWYQKVLEVKPDHGPALAAIGRIQHFLGRWDALLDTLGRELKTLKRPDDKVTLLTQMGDIAARQLGHDDKAITYYQRAIEIDPTFGPALHALYQKLREADDFKSLVEVMEKELSGIDDAESKARNAVQLAEVHEIKRNNPASALKAYVTALESQPDFRPAIDGLVRTATHLEKWSELSEQLLKMADNALDDVEATGALFKAGEVLSDYLGETNKAISAFEGILERQPGNLTALLDLADLYRETSSWSILSEVYGRLSHLIQDNKEKVMALSELVRLVEIQEIETGSDVRSLLGAILSIDTQDLATLTALEHIALETNDSKLLALVDGYLVKTIDEPTANAVYLSRLATSVEATNAEQAIAACRTALAADPENLSAIRCLKRLAHRTNAHKVLTEALKREAKWTQKSEAAADLLVQAANIHLRQLDDPQRAVDKLEAALERCPEHSAAMRQISELLADNVGRLIEIISRAANATKNNDVKAEYWAMVAKLQADTQDNLAGGINALVRMLKEKPNHVPTMIQLAELYKRNRQWEEAAEVLEKVVKQRPSRKQMAEVQMDLARIAEKHLKNYSRAMMYVEDLLKVEPKNSEGLTMLCDIQYRNDNLEAAGQTAEKLLKVSTDDDERALALFCVGRVKLKRGSRKGGAAALREAITLAGPAIPAAREYKTLLGKHEPWSKYINALGEYQKRVANDPSQRENLVAVVCELSTAQHEGMNNTQEAIDILTQGIVRLGDHPLLKLNLGLRLLDQRDFDGAIAEFSRLLADDPANANGWRAMQFAMRAKGETEEAAHALAPLVVLDEASAKERQQYDHFLGRPGLAEAGSFSKENLWMLSPKADGELEATDLLVTLNDAIAKLYPPNLEKYGLTGRNKIIAGSSNPLRVIADALGRAFGLKDFDLYVDASGIGSVAIELTQPLSIVLPGHIKDLRQASQVFIVARALAYATRGQQAALTLEPTDLEMLLAAASYKFRPDLSEDRFGAATLERLGKQLYKATSWRGRKSVEEAAQRYAAVMDGIFDRCAQSMNLTAIRAAAILSCDLISSVDELRRMSQNLSRIGGKDLVKRSPEISDLLSFWISESAFEIRHKAGIL